MFNLKHPAHPEEPLSLSKWHLEGYLTLQSFETGLRQAQPLLRMSG
jgi:hypothetical protein